jgi:hypothetical protein
MICISLVQIFYLVPLTTAQISFQMTCTRHAPVVVEFYVESWSSGFFIWSSYVLSAANFGQGKIYSQGKITQWVKIARSSDGAGQSLSEKNQTFFWVLWDGKKIVLSMLVFGMFEHMILQEMFNVIILVSFKWVSNRVPNLSSSYSNNQEKFALLQEEQFFLKIKMILITKYLFYILLFFMKNKIFILYLLLFMNKMYILYFALLQSGRGTTKKKCVAYPQVDS